MKNKLIIPLCLVTAIIVTGITPFFGTITLTPVEIFNSGSPESLIFWKLRIPRTLCAFFAGSGLALGGLVFQSMFRNPLATPYTLGISGGAALGASIYIRFGAAMAFSAGPLTAAFTGCILSMLFIYWIASWKDAFSANSLLLAGISISFLFSSLVMLVQYTSNANDAVQIMRWLMGSLANVNFQQLMQLSIIVGICFFLILNQGTELDLSSAGEEIALSRGVNTKKLRLLLFLLTSILIGGIVSITGPIGFVGMIIPQICRMITGYAHKTLIPFSFLAGGIFLVLCDLASRVIIAPAELPVGIITALTGSPFFLWILLRSNSHVK